MSDALNFSADAKRLMIIVQVFLVVFVVGAVLAGIWHATAAFIADLRTTQSLKQIVPLINKVREFSNSGYVEDSLSTTLINAGLVPADMVRGKQLISVWEDEIQFSTLGNLEKKDHFVLTYRNVPKLDCEYFVKRVSELPKIMGLFGIAATTGQLLRALPVTEGQAELACQLDKNYLAFIFKL